MSLKFLPAMGLCLWMHNTLAQNIPAIGKATTARQNCSAVSVATCDVAHALRRGINLGNMLDAPREGDWGVRLEPSYIDLVAERFNTVRLPVRWSNNAAPTVDAKLDEFFATRVDKVVDALLKKGVYVILDLHHYNQISGDKLHRNEFEVDPSIMEQRLFNMWKQIADRYKNHSPKLLFELLNEPHGRLNGAPWNELARKTLEVVRASNPTRTVLIGPTYWNNVKHLNQLRVPPDKNIIVAIHSYEPFTFTHQGISYLPMPLPIGQKCCDAAQRKVITDTLDTAKEWNLKNGYPMHLGEFGSNRDGEINYRSEYARFMRDELEKRAIGWAYWDFAASFGIFSPKTKTWIEPLRSALLDS